MSFGKGYSPNKRAVDKAVRYAEKKDVLLVHAAGNGSADNDIEDNFPNDTYEKGFGFLFFKKKQPNNWIEVGALSNSADENLVAPFSNYGKTSVDVFAPGMYMLAPVPDDNYQILQGTSMAAPVVSGIAAVLRGYFPKLKAKEIKSVLMNSALKSDMPVIVPGKDGEEQPFSQLSVSEGAVNLYSALKYAIQEYRDETRLSNSTPSKSESRKKKSKTMDTASIQVK
jgi:subtilisin family serine protease